MSVHTTSVFLQESDSHDKVKEALVRTLVSWRWCPQTRWFHRQFSPLGVCVCEWGYDREAVWSCQPKRGELTVDKVETPHYSSYWSDYYRSSSQTKSICSICPGSSQSRENRLSILTKRQHSPRLLTRRLRRCQRKRRKSWLDASWRLWQMKQCSNHSWRCYAGTV